MERKILEKDMIFYNAGHTGAAFTIKSGNFLDPGLLEETINHLEYETEKPISYVKERRTVPRTI